MPYSDFSNVIAYKTERAAQAMVIARLAANSITSIAAANVFACESDDDATALRVVLRCDRAVAQLPWEGNWDADLEVEVRCVAADTSIEDFAEISGQVAAFFFQAKETVADRLSNADVKYTAQFCIPVEHTKGKDAGSDGKLSERWMRWLFRVTCSGSVIE